MRHTVLALLFVTCVLGQAVVPETPAGRVFTEWLAAFNSAGPRTDSRLRRGDLPARSSPARTDAGFSRTDRRLHPTAHREKRATCRSSRCCRRKNSDTVGRLEFSGELPGTAENREFTAAGHSPSSRSRASADVARGRAASASGTRRGVRQERPVLGCRAGCTT